MKKESALLFDCEIVNCIPPQDGVIDLRFTYCEGWKDFFGMGISCVCAYDMQEDRYRVFLADNLQEFWELQSKRDHIIGFNSMSFDDKLMAANGYGIVTSYDLLRECRKACGEPPDYVAGVSRGGFGLEELCQSNLGKGKSGNGALAPVLWQQGKRGAVIDYCISDCALEYELLVKGIEVGIKSPVDGSIRKLRNPFK